LPNPEGRRTLQDAAFLTADYGLTERINVGFLIPYRSSRSRGRVEGEVEGLGDIGLSARFAFNEPHSPGLKANGIVLATLPTGEVETGFLDENIVLGVGAVGLGAGFEVIHDRPGLGSAFLRVLGSKPAGASDGGVRFGGSLSASAGYGRPFAGGGRIRWALSGGVTWNEADRENGLAVLNRGGRLAFATAGVSFPLGRDFELSAGAQRLVAADLRGDQLAAEWSGYAAIRWTRLVRDKSARLRGL
jgi:hypothetical protein